MSDESSPDLLEIGRIPALRTILEVVCRVTGMGFAAIARVTEDRWVACAVRDDGLALGLEPGGELEIETTFCTEIRLSRQPVIFDDVSTDHHYIGHGKAKRYGIQSYISVPIVLPDGTFFGTLCALDRVPRRVNTPTITGMFMLFSELIAFHIDSYGKLASKEALLLTERQTGELREQFIAVLGHDLRNPLNAIDINTFLLSQRPLDNDSARLVGEVRDSAKRMSLLIKDLLDFAHGRLGGGIAVHRSRNYLERTLAKIIAETQATLSNRAIETDFANIGPVDCDASRIGQMLSNLLSNAATHGAHDSPIRVSARRDDKHFELSVANRGTPLPRETMENLFKPFFRASQGHEGLGLGLYIALEIAKAHGGTLTVNSSETETRFTFRMPQVPLLPDV